MNAQWVIAAATIAYCVVTYFLLVVTKKTADAALQSAEVTRNAFETVNRPYLGVSHVSIGDINAMQWFVTVTWKNFGSLPAPQAVFHGQLNVSGNVLFAEAEPAIEIFPGSEFIWRKDFPRAVARYDELLQNRVTLAGFGEIQYSVPNGKKYLHRSDFVLRVHAQRFDLVEASTVVVP
jgi:hypothetical protein